jgi:hypothetical protein
LSFTNVMPGVVQCNDCGAHADTEENIVHYDSCVAGTSAHWEKVYAADEEDTEPYCNNCTGIQEIGIDACSGCCGR